MRRETGPGVLQRALLIAALLGLAACAARRAPGPPPDAVGDEAARRITVDALAAPIRFLSDDLLEGRAPGTRGDALSRLYIKEQMQSLGLRPGGAGGNWEQPVELVGVTTTAPARWGFAGPLGRLQLANREEFVAVSPQLKPAVAINGAELVFVGYGIEAPEYDWDDFKGVDVRGKVLLMLNNDPDWDPELFAGRRRLYYGRWTYKHESAARHGARGAIIIHTDASAGYPWQTVQTSWSGENSRLPDDGAPEVPVHAWVTEDAAARLVALGGRDLAALVEAARRRDFRPVPLKVTTSLQLRNKQRRYRTANVLGVLPGGDPALANQFVVYTAHHDHLGVQPRGKGKDAIYNGALDNAAGIAQMLAVARAFTALPDAPRRSILFLAVAAEEQGLLGSAYYCRHPTVPPARLAANLNIDGGNIWGRTRDVTAVGFGKSTLDTVAEAAADAQGRTYGDDPFPERGHFYRSDQFNLARIGVPALFLNEGLDFVGRPPDWGRAQVDAWLEQHYHQPSDEMDATWVLDGMVDDARLLFAIGRRVADADQPPRWLAGDEFEAVER